MAEREDEPAGALVPLLIYSVARIGLFLGLWLALLALRLDPLLAAVGAAALSLPLSWYLLAPARSKVTERVLARRQAHRVIDPDRLPPPSDEH